MSADIRTVMGGAAAQVEQRVLPRIIGRPADAEQLIIRAGQRAEEVQRAAAAASPSRMPPPAASAPAASAAV